MPGEVRHTESDWRRAAGGGSAGGGPAGGGSAGGGSAGVGALCRVCRAKCTAPCAQGERISEKS